MTSDQMSDTLVECLWAANQAKFYDSPVFIRVQAERGGGKTEFAIRFAMMLRTMDKAWQPHLVVCGTEEDIAEHLRMYTTDRALKMISATGAFRLQMPIGTNFDESFKSLETNALIIDDFHKMTGEQYVVRLSRLRLDNPGKIVVVVENTRQHSEVYFSETGFPIDLSDAIRRKLPYLSMQDGKVYSSAFPRQFPGKKGVTE